MECATPTAVCPFATLHQRSSALFKLQSSEWVPFHLHYMIVHHQSEDAVVSNLGLASPSMMANRISSLFDHCSVFQCSLFLTTTQVVWIYYTFMTASLSTQPSSEKQRLLQQSRWNLHPMVCLGISCRTYAFSTFLLVQECKYIDQGYSERQIGIGSSKSQVPCAWQSRPNDWGYFAELENILWLILREARYQLCCLHTLLCSFFESLHLLVVKGRYLENTKTKRTRKRKTQTKCRLLSSPFPWAKTCSVSSRSLCTQTFWWQKPASTLGMQHILLC
jgi:hypothetical protein